MASQSENINQTVVVAGYDFALRWLNKAETIGDAQRLLSDLCTNYDVHRASVLSGDQMHDNIRWEVTLSSSGGIKLTDILPTKNLLEILNEDLRRDKLTTVKLSANNEDTKRHLFFIVVDNQLLKTTVFVFESKYEISFVNLAALRLISDVLCKNFTENGIFIESNKQQEHKLTETEYDLLRLKSAGQSDEYLAEALNLSPHTIYYMLQHAMKKLGCQNSHSAIAKISKLDR